MTLNTPVGGSSGSPVAAFWGLGGPVACELLVSRHRLHALLNQLPEASAQLQADLGFQYDLVLASVLDYQPMNPIEVHDDRAVNATKPLVAQVLLEFQECPTDDVRVTAHMHAGVISRSLDPVDVRDIHKEDDRQLVAQQLEHVKAAAFGHLHVEKYQIRLRSSDLLDSLHAGRAFDDGRDVRITLQQYGQVASRQ